MIHNPNITNTQAKYLDSIYKPYEYLRSKGVSYLNLKSGERIVLFETEEGAVNYFNEYIYHMHTDGTLVLPPKKGVHYVFVEHPGVYTAVDLAIADIYSHTVYGNFYTAISNHPKHGPYIGWAYLQRKTEIDNSNYALNV
jgi:hypothetical protein